MFGIFQRQAARERRNQKRKLRSEQKGRKAKGKFCKSSLSESASSRRKTVS